MFKVYKIKGKKAISRSKIPEADWAINYYTGCQHSCIYCFLKFLTKWRKQKEAWGDFVDVKINAPDLVEEESEVSPHVDHLTFEDLNMSPCRFI